MRHASLTLAEEINRQLDEGHSWDLLFCSDMLNLPEFMGMVSSPIPALPAVVYFHENQLTYPTRQPRDYHYGYSNFLSALRADAVWFNSHFHEVEFLEAIEQFLRRMPDYQHLDAVEKIRNKASVQPPGVEPPPTNQPTHDNEREGSLEPLRILWCARWEHDKNAELFFAALRRLKAEQARFRLAVIGPSFRDVPEVFGKAKSEFESEIDYWGHQASREDYGKVLSWADVMVSTAVHEFFGLSVVEAVLAGAFPLLPERLAYPEVLGAQEPLILQEHFYQGREQPLADRLRKLVERKGNGRLWQDTDRMLRNRLKVLTWPQHAQKLDSAVELAAHQKKATS